MLMPNKVNTAHNWIAMNKSSTSIQKNRMLFKADVLLLSVHNRSNFEGIRINSVTPFTVNYNTTFLVAHAHLAI